MTPQTPTSDPGAESDRKHAWRGKGLCPFTLLGSWSGELYVCDQPAGHKLPHDITKMRQATPDENRRFHRATS